VESQETKAYSKLQLLFACCEFDHSSGLGGQDLVGHGKVLMPTQAIPMLLTIKCKDWDKQKQLSAFEM
jgi:hypothetical protein